MVVLRTPRPPVVVPKPVELRQDPNEIERWVARLARAIRLMREQQRFLAAQTGPSPLAEGGTVPERR